MKKYLLISLLCVSVSVFAQSINSFKAVIIPLKYDFLKQNNEYRLITQTKLNLKKAGFVAFYENETLGAEYNNRCSLLHIDVKNDSSFLITKLYVVLTDCNGKVIYQSDLGKSREKEYDKAYSIALDDAFVSIYKLNYKYDSFALPTPAVESKTAIIPASSAPAQAVLVSPTPVVSEKKHTADLLYAQATNNGFQLVDASPKVVLRLYSTSRPDFYIAVKGTIQGVLIQKESRWFFEYYANEKLEIEKIAVKF